MNSKKTFIIGHPHPFKPRFYISLPLYNDNEISIMLKETPAEQLFEIKRASSRKQTGKRVKYNVIRIRDGVIICRGVNGKTRAENIVMKHYKKEKKIFDKEIEETLLGKRK